MPEPIYDDTTERMYAGLPGVYRFEDTHQDWTLKKYLSGIAGELGAVDDLVDRIAYTPPEDHPANAAEARSDLVDPDYADASWLPWLAQLVGVRFKPGLTVAQQRAQISDAAGGVRAGTEEAIVQAAQTVLTGTKTVYVYPFSNSGGGVNAGTQWEVLIMTLSEETTGDVVDAVVKAGAKPAGVKLYHTNYGASWATLEGLYTTWAAWERPWEQIERGTTS